MPRKLVFAAWEEAFPDRKQRVLQPSEPIDHPFVEIARFEALESFAKPFAEKFLVSPIAMRIRLERLGLLTARCRFSGFCPMAREPFF